MENEKSWKYNLYEKTLRLFEDIFNKNNVLSVELKEKLPEEGPAIVLSNHMNYFDPIWIALAFHKNTKKKAHIDFMMQDKFLGKKGILSNLNGLFNSIIKNYNAHIIDRDATTPTQIKEFITILKDKEKVLGVFPGGQRSRTGIYNEKYNGDETRVIKMTNSAQKKGYPVKIIESAITYNNLNKKIIVSFGKVRYFGPKETSKDLLDEKINSFTNEMWKNIGSLVKANLDSIGAYYLYDYCNELVKGKNFQNNIYINRTKLSDDLFLIVNEANNLNKINLDSCLLDKDYFLNEFNNFIQYWGEKKVLINTENKVYLLNKKEILNPKQNTGGIIKVNPVYAKNRIDHYDGLTERIKNQVKKRIYHKIG
jgi:1-acyl-sn-glycerol-3-phosphate acyltransferase